MQVFETLTVWHWFALAGALLVFEVLLPITFFLWVGVAAAVTGVVALIVDLDTEAQILVFSTLSVVSIALSRVYLRRRAPERDRDSSLSRRGEQHIGKTYTLAAAIENGVGKVKVGDSLWRVEGEDRPAGGKVTVVGVRGSSFMVEGAD